MHKSKLCICLHVHRVPAEAVATHGDGPSTSQQTQSGAAAHAQVMFAWLSVFWCMTELALTVVHEDVRTPSAMWQ